MGKTIRNTLKFFSIGLITTIVRVIGQLSIPAGEQTVLAPSVFAQNGTCRWPLLSMGYSLIP